MKGEYIERLTKYYIKKKGMEPKAAEEKAQQSWKEYYKENKESIDAAKRELKEAFDRSVEMEFRKFELGLDDY